MSFIVVHSLSAVRRVDNTVHFFSPSLFVSLIKPFFGAFPAAHKPLPRLIYTLLQLGYAERDCAMRGRAPNCTVFCGASGINQCKSLFTVIVSLADQTFYLVPSQISADTSPPLLRLIYTSSPAQHIDLPRRSGV